MKSLGAIVQEHVSGCHCMQLCLWMPLDGRVSLGGRHDDEMALSGMGAKRGILPVEGLLETP